MTNPPFNPTGPVDPAQPNNQPPYYGQQAPPVANNRRWWVIGGVIALVVFLILCCGTGSILVKKAAHNPNPTPSLTSQRKAVYDFAVTSLDNISRSGTTAGFPLTKLKSKYLFLGQTATCGNVELGGTTGKYPAYWCSSDSMFYFEEAVLTTEKAKSDDTAFSYILNSYSIAQASAKPAATDERRSCTAGAVARQETNAGRLTLGRAEAIRDFITDTKSQSDAFTTGYNSGKAVGCSSY